MIHWIAGRERGVVVVAVVGEEDESRRGHLPSRGKHEAGDSREDCVGVTVHVDRGRVEERGIGVGGTRHR